MTAFLWYLYMFYLRFVSYIVFLLVFWFYMAAIDAVNAALLSCPFLCLKLNVRVFDILLLANK